MSSRNNRLNKNRRHVPTRPAAATADVPKMRAAIAEAVHQTVCEETNSDGCGHCMLYAIVGAFLSSRVFGGRYWPQAGTLQVQHDPEDPNHWMIFDARDNGVDGGEFHSWFARETTGARGRSLPAEIVDLSSRHYPALVCLPAISDRQTTIAGDLALTVVTLDHKRRTWKRKEPCPPYLWIDGNRQLNWVQLIADEAATHYQWDKVGRHQDFYKRLLEQAWKKYQELVA
jgi:hypothetical protein